MNLRKRTQVNKFSGLNRNCLVIDWDDKVCSFNYNFFCFCSRFLPTSFSFWVLNEEIFTKLLRDEFLAIFVCLLPRPEQLKASESKHSTHHSASWSYQSSLSFKAALKRFWRKYSCVKDGRISLKTRKSKRMNEKLPNVQCQGDTKNIACKQKVHSICYRARRINQCRKAVTKTRQTIQITL